MDKGRASSVSEGGADPPQGGTPATARAEAEEKRPLTRFASGLCRGAEAHLSVLPTVPSPRPVVSALVLYSSPRIVTECANLQRNGWGKCREHRPT
jgi:hypothetical protein